MANLLSRKTPLTAVQRKHLIDVVIPGRIDLIMQCTQKGPLSDVQLAAAAIHTRALAEFLGIGHDPSTDRLIEKRRYHPHGNGSFEVKITDLDGALYTEEELEALSDTDKDAIKEGLHSTHREFAHLTYWPDEKNQGPDGGPLETYGQKLTDRIRAFSGTIIRLVNERLLRCSVPTSPVHNA